MKISGSAHALHSLAWFCMVFGILESSNMDPAVATKLITLNWERTAMITHKVAQRARLFNRLKTLDIVAKISLTTHS